MVSIAPGAVRLFSDALAQLGLGRAVTIVPDKVELTAQEVAVYLNASVPLDLFGLRHFDQQLAQCYCIPDERLKSFWRTCRRDLQTAIGGVTVNFPPARVYRTAHEAELRLRQTDADVPVMRASLPKVPAGSSLVRID